MKARWIVTLSAVAALLAASDCRPVFLWDMEFFWTVNQSSSTTACQTYGIETWEVIADGPDEGRTRSFTCGSWSTGTQFFDIAEGTYNVTVRALDINGVVLASRSKLAEVFENPSGAPVIESVDFKHVDFTPGGGPAKIDIYWNINGSQDASGTGLSWDTCDEVGASRVEITLDGKVTRLDCKANEQTTAVGVAEGTHTVAVKLLDKNGADLTTTAGGTISATASKPGEVITDFWYNSFKQGLDKSMTGDYWYYTNFESKNVGCSQTVPKVRYTSLLLKDLGGSPVTADVCASSCFKTDGKAGPCFEKSETAKIKGRTWGLYKMTISGMVSDLTICWEKKKFSDRLGYDDILIGAGSSNPKREWILSRISSSGSCQ